MGLCRTTRRSTRGSAQYCTARTSAVLAGARRNADPRSGAGRHRSAARRGVRTGHSDRRAGAVRSTTRSASTRTLTCSPRANGARTRSRDRQHPLGQGGRGSDPRARPRALQARDVRPVLPMDRPGARRRSRLRHSRAGRRARPRREHRGRSARAGGTRLPADPPRRDPRDHPPLPGPTPARRPGVRSDPPNRYEDALARTRFGAPPRRLRARVGPTSSTTSTACSRGSSRCRSPRPTSSATGWARSRQTSTRCSPNAPPAACSGTGRATPRSCSLASRIRAGRDRRAGRGPSCPARRPPSSRSRS